MSSPSRKVGLRKRFSIAVKSAAAGATAGILTPVLLYRGWVREAESDKPPLRIDWHRLGNTINSSGVVQMLLSDLIEMRSGREEVDWVDEDEDGDFQEDPTVH